jgi:peptidoglycan/xylan/chitin deacetylase (PgdA/CDA1 family)
MQVEQRSSRVQRIGSSQESVRSFRQSSLKVSTIGFDVPELSAIRNLLYPFRIEYVTNAKHSDVTISKGSSEPKIEYKKLILVPVLESDKVPENQGNGILVLPYDIVSACVEKFEAVMNPKISMIYNLSTRLPFDYNLVPSSIRSRVLKTQQQRTDLDLLRHLSVEMARRKFVESFAGLGLRLERKNPPSIIVTHDIDTEKGLERAASLKEIEEDFGIHSTWFVVSDEYPISKETARYLAESSEIGSHDEKHDGRLLHIKKQEDLVKRLRRSKERLGEIFEKEITSFRAPLLQFNSRIISALGKSGYHSDFSLPSWEPVHPSTMQGFGVESACEFELGGIVEHPLTLFQDHQVLKVLGMSTSRAIKFWMNQMSLIRAFDGDIVLLIHPDYSFSQDLESYKKLIETISFLNMENHVNILGHAS